MALTDLSRQFRDMRAKPASETGSRANAALEFGIEDRVRSRTLVAYSGFRGAEFIRTTRVGYALRLVAKAVLRLHQPANRRRRDSQGDAHEASRAMLRRPSWRRRTARLGPLRSAHRDNGNYRSMALPRSP